MTRPVMSLQDYPEIGRKREVFLEYAHSVLGIRGPMFDYLTAAFNTVDDGFFTAAASSSGKYHPASSLGDGGLVRHTIVTASIAVGLMGMYDLLSPESRNEVIVACLLHDAWKCCDETGVWRSHSNAAGHGRIGADALLKIDCGEVSLGSIDRIIHAVRWHMSRWGDHSMPYVAMSDAVTMIVAMADYVASRKQLSYEVL